MRTLGAGAEPEVFKRHADLGRPSVGADMAGALPDPVGREVFSVAAALERVHLDSAWIHEQVIRQLTRAARVETEAHPVVAERVVASADGRADPVRLRIKTSERDVERLVVVGHPHVRRSSAAASPLMGLYDIQVSSGSGSPDHASSSSTPSSFGGVAIRTA